MTATRSLRHRLADVAHGRDLSPGATAEYCRLVLDGTDLELTDALDHLRAIPIRRTVEVDVCDRTTARFDELWASTSDRRERHRARIVTVACALARDVAAYRITMPEADRRLERLCGERDLEVLDLGEVRLLPWREASALAAGTFRHALDEAERERRSVCAS